MGRHARAIVGYAAAVSALPYLGLKLLWLFGSDVGITDPAFADDGGIYALNLLTAACCSRTRRPGW